MKRSKQYKVGKGRRGGSKIRAQLLRGPILALLLLALMITAISCAVSRGLLPPERLGAASKSVYLIALTVGCFLAAKNADTGKLLWSALTGICGFAFSACGIWLADDGAPGIGPLLLLTGAAILAGGIAACFGRKHTYGF